jgi:hypothetical protein
MLKNRGDAKFRRILRLAHAYRLTVQSNFAAIGQDRSGHYLDHRRFSGAIIPNDGMHFVSSQTEVDILESAHMPVLFGYAAQGQQRRFVTC